MAASTSNPRTLEQCIDSLAGRYTMLQDSHTISGTNGSRKFNSYVYQRKLLIRKTIPNDETHHLILCTHCTKGKWRVNAESTTSSLQLRHLRQNHKLPTSSDEERHYLQQLEAKTSDTPFSTARQLATRRVQDKFDNMILREHISQFIISSNASLSVVENSTFRNLLQYCNPSTVPISRRTAARDIIKLYNKLKPRILEVLEDYTTTHHGRISLTLDTWTSSTQIPFLGITAHYIDPTTWTYRTILLAFERLRGSHSAVALAQVTEATLKAYKICGSIRAITADSASVNDAMFRLLENQLPNFTCHDSHIRCMGHVINLAVQAMLKELKASAISDEANIADDIDDAPDDLDTGTISVALYKARKIIAKIRSSNILWESLQAQAQVVHITAKRPILDMRVRWNSTYSMLERLLELQPAITAVCRLEDKLRPLQLIPSEWALLQELKQHLHIFIKATQHLSGQSYPTLSAQLPYFAVLATKLEQQVEHERINHSIFTNACNRAWEKLNDYHIKTGSAQAISIILDPRCKLQTFHNLSWRLEWITDAQESIQRVYQNQYAPSLPSRPPTPPSTTNTDMDNDFILAVFGSSQPEQSSTISELDRYLEEKVEAPQVDPIEWWRTYELRFPTLSIMARDYLAIPATSVPSER